MGFEPLHPSRCMMYEPTKSSDIGTTPLTIRPLWHTIIVIVEGAMKELKISSIVKLIK